MKQKRADRPGWRRVKKMGYTEKRVESEAFTGYAVRLTLDEVTEPAFMTVDGRELRVGDNGYCYLQYFPDGEAYAVTRMLDERGHTVQWYIDICREHGRDERGFLYYDDLYLDIVVLPDGAVFLLDQDELDEALAEGAISAEDHRFACETADDLLAKIAAGQRNVFDYPDVFA